MASSSSEAPWYESFPKPESTPKTVSREELKDQLELVGREDKTLTGTGFFLVDVRRDDYKGGTIQGSINIPAQSIWYFLDELFDLCVQASIKTVIFYCGSSAGRGTRSAAWFQDKCNAKRCPDLFRVAILTGGIKGWVSAGKEYTDLMVGYNSDHWGNAQ